MNVLNLLFVWLGQCSAVNVLPPVLSPNLVLLICSNGAHAHTKKAVQEPSNHKDFWMNALGVVAIAVLTMLFAKGKLRVRTV